MIVYVKNYHKNKLVISGPITLKYILEINTDVICINYQLKKIIKLIIKLHNIIKFYKNPINLRRRELGIISHYSL